LKVTKYIIMRFRLHTYCERWKVAFNCVRKHTTSQIKYDRDNLLSVSLHMRKWSTKENERRSYRVWS